jgi:hypothetical protein
MGHIHHNNGVSWVTRLDELIAAHDVTHPLDSDEELAARVMQRVTKTDLLPLLVDAVSHYRRVTTRALERSASVRRLRNLVTQRPAGQTITQLFDEIEGRERIQALLRRKWALGDSRTVDVGQATLDEIRQRLVMLRRQAAGMQQTIEFLTDVEAELVRTGARCLDDLISAA